MLRTIALASAFTFGSAQAAHGPSPDPLEVITGMQVEIFPTEEPAPLITGTQVAHAIASVIEGKNIPCEAAQGQITMNNQGIISNTDTCDDRDVSQDEIIKSANLAILKLLKEAEILDILESISPDCGVQIKYVKTREDTLDERHPYSTAIPKSIVCFPDGPNGNSQSVPLDIRALRNEHNETRKDSEERAHQESQAGTCKIQIPDKII